MVRPPTRQPPLPGRSPANRSSISSRAAGKGKGSPSFAQSSSVTKRRAAVAAGLELGEAGELGRRCAPGRATRRRLAAPPSAAPPSAARRGRRPPTAGRARRGRRRDSRRTATARRSSPPARPARGWRRRSPSSRPGNSRPAPAARPAAPSSGTSNCSMCAAKVERAAAGRFAPVEQQRAPAHRRHRPGQRNLAVEVEDLGRVDQRWHQHHRRARRRRNRAGSPRPTCATTGRSGRTRGRSASS